ncbi:hypothetical protein M3Y99_01092700 [Aphelenchoides fujianensis]|nr:hypothetical protein M3Y99_01092700 [Aphelenchoides fujianensis]
MYPTRLRRVQDVVATNTNPEAAFFEVHDLVQSLPLLERLLPLLKAMKKLQKPLDDGVERLLNETLILVAQWAEEEANGELRRARCPQAAHVFLFLFLCGQLSGALFANNRRSIGWILVRGESLLLQLLTAKDAHAFRLCSEIFVWAWAHVEDESKPRTNQKLLDTIGRLLSSKRKHPNGALAPTNPVDRLFDSFLLVDKAERPHAVHVLWKLNKRMLEQKAVCQGGLTVSWPHYVDVLRATHDSADPRLQRHAVEQLTLFLRTVDAAMLPQMREFFERLGIGIEAPIVMHATEAILERFGRNGPILPVLLDFYVQRFLENERKEGVEFPPIEYRILELLLRYAPADLLGRDQSLQILNRLTADVDGLLANSRRLRLFSVFLERRDLHVPVPIDLTVSVLLKTHSLNGRLLEVESRIEQERCRKFVSILLHSRQFLAEI